MAEVSRSLASGLVGPEHGEDDVSTDSNANAGPSESSREEDIQRAQILAHARSVATPPATPSMSDEIEMDITSKDLSEHAPGLLVARRWIRPAGLTEQEISEIIHRLEVDLTLALGRIRAKSCRKRKPRNEDMLMIDMRMAGKPARGANKVKLRPCIWVFCGSKWCQKIVERDVKALNWFGPYDVHLVRKGGPVLSADDTRPAEAPEDLPIDHRSREEYPIDGQNQLIETASSPAFGNPSIYGSYNGLSYSAQGYILTDPKYGSAGTYGISYLTTAATSSTGGYEYQTESSSTSTYGHYATCDTASIASSSIPSAYGGGSARGWSDSQSRGTAPSTAPSIAPSTTPSLRQSRRTDVNNTIHRQPPFAQRYQLPCEFHNLTGCNIVFNGDDTQAWIEHVEGHFRSNFPTKLRCWFCNDYYFDASQTSGGDCSSNFMIRMQHIHDHLVYDGNRLEHSQKDGHVVQHLLDHKLIDRRTYDSIINPTSVPPVPGYSSHRGHRSHHSRLQQFEEEIDAVSGARQTRYHHRSGHRKKQNRGGSHTGGGRTRDSGDAQSLAPLSSNIHNPPLTTQRIHRPSKGQDTSRDGEYAQSFASLSLSDHVSHVPRSDYYDPLYADVYGSSYEPTYARNDHHALTAPSSTKSHSGIALWGSAELRLHVQSRWLTSLVGLSCISTTWRGHTELSRSIAKMGGALSITIGGKTSLYGVTSGHGMIHQILDVAPQSFGGDDSSIDGISESSDSESEDEDAESPPLSAKGGCSGDRASTDSAIDLGDPTEWTPINHGLTAGFIGIGFHLASQRNPQLDGSHVEDTHFGDLALFPIHSIRRPGLTNYYIDPGNLEAKEVTVVSEENVRSTTPVVILLGPEQTVSGTLQPGRFHFSIRGMAIDARQIRLPKDLAMGSSGSWVVQDKTLYGMIVAVFPGECMALMVPAKKMMSDIRTLFPGATDISAAVR